MKDMKNYKKNKKFAKTFYIPNFIKKRYVCQIRVLLVNKIGGQDGKEKFLDECRL